MLEAATSTKPVTLDNLGDLRRRSRADVADRILARAAHLPDRERTLLEALYRDGKSAKDLARLARVPARVLRLHVHRIIQRLSSPIFAWVLLERPNWPLQRQRVATLHILEGRSIRSTANLLALSVHQVRAHLAWIGMQLEARDQSTIITRSAAQENRR